jgi:ring-1,2-phenylacetyl-CoA epoxidase subunit PaaD
MTLSLDQIRSIISQVADPEIPVITIQDLGVLRDVKIIDNTVTVYITPTYTGCPAMDMIEVNIKSALQEAGISDVKIVTVLQPVWTTDWMSPEGKQKLLDYGIAPPSQKTSDLSFIRGEPPKVICPQCGSKKTEMISQFGSTACKSMYKCLNCLEPFDYFKCH